MKKFLLFGVGGIVLVVIVFVWQVVANLDSIVAGVIEDVGSDVLQTKVTVTDVSINLTEGKAGIGGMTVANPEGYSSANVFTMEGIEVDLDLQSLSDDVLVVESIRVRNPRVVFEGNVSGGSNMQVLLENIASTPVGDGEAAGRKVIKMIIDRFEFSGGVVKATTALKPGKVVEFELPPIRMSGIGRPEGGVTAEEVMQQITVELANGVIKAAMRAEVDKVIEKQKKKLTDKLGDILRGDG